MRRRVARFGVDGKRQDLVHRGIIERVRLSTIDLVYDAFLASTRDDTAGPDAGSWLGYGFSPGSKMTFDRPSGERRDNLPRFARRHQKRCSVGEHGPHIFCACVEERARHAVGENLHGSTWARGREQFSAGDREGRKTGFSSASSALVVPFREDLGDSAPERSGEERPLVHSATIDDTG